MLQKLLDTLKPFHENPELFFPAMETTFAKGSGGLSLIQRAYRVAESAHQGVQRETGEDYLTHPTMSAIILNVYGGNTDETATAGTVVHDVEEDAGDKWPHERIALEVSPGAAEIASWCNKHRFDTLPVSPSERERLFLQNLLMVAPRNAALPKLSEFLHNLITPYKTKLANELWRKEKVLVARMTYAMLAQKHGFLYHEILEAAEALEGGQCLLPANGKAEISLE